MTYIAPTIPELKPDPENDGEFVLNPDNDEPVSVIVPDNAIEEEHTVAVHWHVKGANNYYAFFFNQQKVPANHRGSLTFIMPAPYYARPFSKGSSVAVSYSIALASKPAERPVDSAPLNFSVPGNALGIRVSFAPCVREAFHQSASNSGDGILSQIVDLESVGEHLTVYLGVSDYPDAERRLLCESKEGHEIHRTGFKKADADQLIRFYDLPKVKLSLYADSWVSLKWQERKKNGYIYESIPLNIYLNDEPLDEASLEKLIKELPELASKP